MYTGRIFEYIWQYKVKVLLQDLDRYILNRLCQNAFIA